MSRKIVKLLYIGISYLHLVPFLWIISLLCSIEEGDFEGFVAMDLDYIGLLILINVSFGLVLLGISLFLIIKARQTREPIRFIVLTTLSPSLTLKA